MGLIQEDYVKAEGRLGGKTVAVRAGGCSQSHTGKWVRVEMKAVEEEPATHWLLDQPFTGTWGPEGQHSDSSKRPAS